jgi:hypothetical protein
MKRREFLKKSSILGIGVLSPSLISAKTIKNRYHFIMPPKPFEYFIKEGKKKGGKILIIGGIHGNESGGYKASDMLIDTELTKGSIAILPRSNPESIFSDMRGYNGDMNRKFSNLSKNDKDFYKINSIKNFIADYKPDVILSLHDGYGFYAKYKTQWGESIIIDEAEYNNIPLLQIANKVSQHLKNYNFNIPINNTKTFSKNTHHAEQRKSLTYYSLQTHNIPAFCIEASKQSSLKRKVQIHLVALQEFFRIYDVEISPSFQYLFSKIDDYTKPLPTKIIAHINNNKKLIQQETILHIPKGTEIKFEVLNNRGGGVVAKNVNLNYHSFFYRDSLKFDVKSDSIKEYSFIIRG